MYAIRSYYAIQVFAAPTVTSTSPANGEGNVLVDSSISVDFSEPMKPSSLTADSFILTRPAAIVAVAAGSYNFV